MNKKLLVYLGKYQCTA